jgi:ABC-type transport system involved in cytochrome c biogenesis permease subunit
MKNLLKGSFVSLDEGVGRARSPLRGTGLVLMAVFMSLLSLEGVAKASETGPARPSLHEFQRIPVLFNGRKMPMDSFARQVLIQLGGRQSVEKKPADEWLAEVIFSPETTAAYPVFLINSPDVVQALGVTPKKRRRYTYAELHQSIPDLMKKAEQVNSIPDEKRSVVEKEILRTASNMIYYSGLLQSFSFAQAHPDFQPKLPEVAETLGLSATGGVSALDLALKVSDVQLVVKNLMNNDVSEWTAEEAETFRLASALFEWSKRFQSAPFDLLPALAHNEENWLSPWMAMGTSLSDPAVRGVLENLYGLFRAYGQNDQEAFDRSAVAVQTFTRSRLPGVRALSTIDLETNYNRWRLFYWSKFIYFFAFLAGVTAFIGGGQAARRAGWILTLAAFLPHTAGILLRMLIMGRPPVTNLYATFIFVAWICVLVSLFTERAQKNGLGIMSAGFSGIGLLMLAARFGAESDTMGQVVAVLDSNFWLSTHVIAITTGYAGCVLAGVVGHVYLLQQIFIPSNKEKLRATSRALFGILGFGLIFSFLGTMLGGVWADQSWGRFWGWDPKENGALLIVLWCAILFHARIGGMIREVGVAVGAALGTIIVMFAWIGVNLLGVGLHSYGFTSGLARGLYTYTVAQIVLLLVLGLLAVKKKKSV